MPSTECRLGISRRDLLRDAAAIGAAAAVAGPAAASARARRPRRRRVAVVGGGMAGLAVAHELVERGFRVDVYEPGRLGGKARSIPVRGTARGGRRPLPGEHGFRFFPGFYHHVPDSMRRIPFEGNPNGVWDNLVATPGVLVSRAGREDMPLPAAFEMEAIEVLTVDNLRQGLISGLQFGSSVPPHELEFFANRLLVFFTSCDERRFGQWEHTSWKDFVRAEGKSEEYRKVVVGAATRLVVAAKEDVASTRTIGNMAEAFTYNIMGRGNDGDPDRVLNAPTNEAWIRPWARYLRERGVRFHMGQKVEALDVKRGMIDSAVVRSRQGRRRRIDADWFVCAVPPERARKLISPAIRRLDPRLEGLDDLFVDWMVGIQFFLRHRLELAKGHIAFIDSPWSITALTQAQFWDGRDFPADYGDGRAVDCLSVDVSDWDTPGTVYGKPAKRCRKKEIVEEVWEQIKAHLNDTEVRITDEDLHSVFIDPAIRWNRKKRRNRNATPLLVNTVGSWEKRPSARTEVPNLFIAGDHVQTNIDLATMESANESGRAAANALLDAAGSNAPGAAMYELYRPPEFEGLKAVDAERYRAGQPNLLDRP